MKNLHLKKSLILILAIILFLASLVAAIGVGLVNVAFATDDQDGVIYYGEDLEYGAGVDSAESEIEYIDYATKNVTEYRINPNFPSYYNTNDNITNGCANVAGANIIGYYDRYYEDLIPNSTPGYIRNNIYYYYPIGIDKALKQDVIDTLYVDMKTNNPVAGTNQTNYKSGLSAFISRKGKNTTFTSVMTNGKFDLNKAIAQFEQGNPITIYTQGFNVSSVTETGDNQTRLVKVLFKSNHIMVAYGYQKEDYYDANGKLVKSNTYLLVSCGMHGLTGNYYILNNNGTLDDAEGVRVY